MAETASRGPIAAVCAAGAAIALVASLAPWSWPDSASPAAAGQAAPAGKEQEGTTGPPQATKNGARQLAIELRLSKDAYSTSESVDATVIFRNSGRSELKLPMIEGEQKLLFFDFVAIGSMGTQFLTNHGQAWGDPYVKEVKLIQLAAGETHTVRLRNVLPFQAFDAGQFEGEQYKVVAVYRDHSYGHSPTYPEFGKEDPAVWKGTVFSNPVTIKRITRREDAQRKAQELQKLIRGFLKSLKDMGVSPEDPRVETLMKKAREGLKKGDRAAPSRMGR